MARDMALCRKLPPVPANLVMILLKQRRSYLVAKIGKKSAKHSPGCTKIIDRSPRPETRVNLINVKPQNMDTQADSQQSFP